MSKPDCVSARPIPTGILVRDVDLPRKQEKAAPAPVVPPRTTLPARRSPWLLLVTAASMAWALVVMTIALRAGGKESEPPRTPEPPAPLLAAALPAPIPTPKMADVPIDDEPFDETIPLPLEPLLPRRPQPLLPPEEAPLLDIAPEEQPKPPAKPPVVPAPARPRKPLDLKVYADCASIGTDVLFVKDPPEAFRRAKAEKKLVYMMHLSGNLEDKDFT
jgi:hypothetical protein